MPEETERWENATKGRVVVRKFDARGNLGHEMVNPGRAVNLTPQERITNQELAANEELDVFKNGTMQPLRLLDGSEDAQEIASNPNHLSDSDVKSLVKGHHKTLEKRLSEITNPAALQRLLEVAKSEDSSISTVQKIQDRLTEVAPSLVSEVVPVPSGGMTDAPVTIKPVTPK